MRRQDKSTPPIPAVTPEEQEALNVLGSLAEVVWLVEWALAEVHSLLIDPPNAEAMGTGEVPESLTFSLRGYIECAQHDHANPLYSQLKDAIAETPAQLVEDWLRRHKGRRR